MTDGARRALRRAGGLPQVSLSLGSGEGMRGCRPPRRRADSGAGRMTRLSWLRSGPLAMGLGEFGLATGLGRGSGPHGDPHTLPKGHRVLNGVPQRLGHPLLFFL